MNDGQSDVLNEKYRIVHKIFDGSCCDVFEAREQAGTRRRVALKRLKDPGRGQAEERFRNAFKTMVRCRHPRLVDVHDLSREPGGRSLCYSMEFIEGAPFPGASLTRNEALFEFLGICQAVEYLHALGFVHGALCPRKILVAATRTPATPNIKLLDYGWEGSPENMEMDEEVLRYRLPEIDEAGYTGHRTDLYALGLLLLETMNGGPVEPSVVYRLRHTDPDVADLRELIPDLPHPITRVVLKLLSHQPAWRFHRIEDVIMEFERAGSIWAGITRPAVILSSTEGCFVDRKPEIRECLESWKAIDPAEPKGRTIIIDGIPGIGKSRFLRELAAEFRAAPWLVIEGRATNPELRFGPFPAVIRSLLQQFGFRKDDPNAELLEWLDPSKESPELFRNRPVPVQLLRKIIEYIGDCSRKQPMILILRDLHLSDLAGMDLFIRLLASLGGFPMMMLGEIRMDECPEEMRRMLAEGTERDSVTVVTLRPLKNNDVRTLTTSILGGGHIPEELYQRVLDSSRGIPLFTEEILRMMIQDRVLRRRFGGWTFDEKEAALTITPLRVREIMRRRVEKLPLRTRRVLQFMAVFGHPIDSGVIAVIFPENHSDPWLLERLVEIGILERTYRKDHQAYQFIHGSLAEVVLEDIPAKTRTRFHLAIAEFLLDHSGDAEEIAFHMLQSGNSRKAVRAAYEAAVQCFHAGAIERAEKLLISAASRLSGSDRTLASKIYYLQAQIAIYRNRVEDIIQAAQHGLESVPRGAAAARVTRIRLLILLAEGFNRKAEFDHAVSILNQAERLAGDSGTLELMEIHVRRSGSHVFTGRYDLAKKDAETALSIYDRLDPDNADAIRVLGNTYNVLAHLFFLEGNIARALETYHKAIEAGRRLNNSYWLAAIHNNLGEIYLYTGDFKAASEHLSLSRDYYRSAGLVLATAIPEVNLGDLYFRLAQTQTAARHYEKALGYFVESNRRGNIISATGQIIRINMANWEFSSVAQKLDEMHKLIVEIPNDDFSREYFYLEGIFHHQQGNLYQAAKSLQHAALYSRRKKPMSRTCHVHIARADVLLDLNDLPLARRQLDKATAIAGKTQDYEGLIDCRLCLSRALRYAGDPVAANRALDDAEQLLGDRYDPRNRFRVSFERVKLRLETESKEDLGDAIRDLRSGVEEFQDIELQANTEILAAKCAAKLGHPDIAMKIIDVVHQRVLGSNYVWLDWQISRMKARFMAEAGIPVTARLEFERAIAQVNHIAARITDSRWRTLFLNRRDIRSLFRQHQNCIAGLNRQVQFEDLPVEKGRPADVKSLIEADLSDMGKTIQSILSTLDIDELFPKISDAAKRLSDGDSALLLLNDSNDQLWVQSGAYDEADRDHRIREKLALQTARIALDSRRIVISRDIHSDPRLINTDEYRKIGVRSLMAIPMISKNRTMGVIYADSRVPGARAIQENRAQLLFLADITAMALENIRLYTDLDSMFVGMVKSLAAAIDAKDPYTRGHSQRVRDFSLAIADMVRLSPEQHRNLELAAFLHDIGKIGIPEGILTQPGPLTPEQRRMIQHHPEIGAEIISPINQLKHVAKIILQHHEWYNGQGYPANAVTDDITLEARILAIADTLDAITTSRPYRGRQTLAEATSEIRKNAGIQFDPRFVKALERAIREGRVVINEAEEIGA